MTLNPSASSIAALDIEGFGRHTEKEQAQLRTAMYDITQQAVELAGLTWEHAVPLDRGDCILLLLPPEVTPLSLVTTFVEQLTKGLSMHNVRIGAPTLRLRLALSVGFTSADPNGWVGNAINQTCRLLDLQLLRQVLAAATRSPIAVILSDNLYQITLGQGHGGDLAAGFQSVPVSVKELQTRGWIGVPGYPTPPGLDLPDEPAAALAQAAAKGQATHYSERGMFLGNVTVNDRGQVFGGDQNNHYGGAR